ncbi:transposase [Nitrosomonas sp.]|uniref:REP-associated tyrosine transposase n=1 Tax=Nitrosomonas sp. TaxID=42353 RepID=UPI00260142D0|nr:transposase [Nitrosomonas sp.]
MDAGLSALPGAGRDVLFTVNLLERRLDLLVRHVDALRAAVRATRMARPFHIDAWVVLPDHMHCVWTLPPGDDDYSNRWKAIKIRFVRALPRTERRSEVPDGQGGAGHLAAAVLGAHHPQRNRLCAAYRLRALESG